LEIERELVLMMHGTGICAYCECNEATDVEHIFPKSLYPSDTFVWDNYLLSCRTCNTDFKKDKFSVFDPEVSMNIFVIPRGTQGPNRASLFINPRAEDPFQLLYLDLVGGSYIFTPNTDDVQSREFFRAKYTIDLLELNIRSVLIEARKSAYRNLFHLLRQYVQVKEANTIDIIESVIDPTIHYDRSQNVADIRQSVCQNIHQSIMACSHRTVWEEMKRQHERIPRLLGLIQHAPEALGW
jgi:uncharacterized protein (TIGR02646 family)